MEQTTSYVKDWFDIIEKIKGIQLQETDLLFSFDITSLFMTISVGEFICLLEEESCIKHCLTTII